MWEIKDADIIDKKYDDQGKVEAWINEINVSCSTSLPTGKDNIALLDAFKSYNYYNNGNQRGTHIIRRQQNFGRGQRRNGITLTDNNQKSRNADKDDADSEGPSADGDVELTKNVRFDDYDQDMNQQNNEEQIEEDLYTAGNDQNKTEPEASGNMKDVDEPIIKEEETNQAININLFDGEGDKKQDPDPQEDQEAEPQNFNEQFDSKAVLNFKIQNNSNLSQVVKITLTPRGPVNFRPPKSEVYCQVFCGSNASVITLTKIRPDKESWGQFDWDIQVVDKATNYMQASSQANTQEVDLYNGGYQDLNTGISDTNNGSEKNCSICTFLNSITATSCSMCGSNI